MTCLLEIRKEWHRISYFGSPGYPYEITKLFISIELNIMYLIPVLSHLILVNLITKEGKARSSDL